MTHYPIQVVVVSDTLNSPRTEIFYVNLPVEEAECGVPIEILHKADFVWCVDNRTGRTVMAKNRFGAPGEVIAW